MDRTLFELIGEDGLILYRETGNGRITTSFVKLSSFIDNISRTIKTVSPIMPFIGEMGTIAYAEEDGRKHMYIITREHIETVMDYYGKKYKNVLVPNLLWAIDYPKGSAFVYAIERKLRDIPVVGSNVLELKLLRVPFSNVHDDCHICFGGQETSPEILPLQFLGSKFNKDLDHGYTAHGHVAGYFEEWSGFSYKKDNGDTLYEKLSKVSNASKQTVGEVVVGNSKKEPSF